MAFHLEEEEEERPEAEAQQPIAVQQAPQQPDENQRYTLEEEEGPSTQEKQPNEFKSYLKGLVKDFGKNAASSATLGQTEHFEALRPDEDENYWAAGAGSLAGALVPITGSAKLAGWGLKYGLKGAKAAMEHGSSALKFLYRFAQGGATGTIYETGKQAGNAALGKEVDPYEIPKSALLFGLGEGVIGNLADRFSKLSPKNQAEVLEKGIIPEGLSKSDHDTAREMLDAVARNRRGGSPPPPGGGPPPPPPTPPRRAPEDPAHLRNRASPQGQDVGLRPAPHPLNPTLQDEVGHVFSPNQFYNTTEAGRALRNEIMDIDETVYRGVGDLYRRSRELNRAINEVHPDLVGQLENRIAELRELPDASDVQKRLLRSSRNIVNRLARYEPVMDETGAVIGREIAEYLPINNQTLIDQIQALRQIIDYDFAHGNIKNIFRPLINELQDAAIGAAEMNGPSQASGALREARNAYRMWAEAFDNDYIRPFRDASNQDYSKLFRSTLDFDEHNMVRRVLDTTPRGQELINASTREIVDKHLHKFFENSRDANPREFEKTLRELSSVTTPEQTQQVRELFRQASRRPNIRARTVPQGALTNEENIAAKYIKKQPEDIQRMMNSRSGIRELREDFQSSPQKQQLFDRLSKQKMRSVLRGENIEQEFTGNELYKALNKEHNYELFSEILGNEETEALRLAAKEIGKEQMKRETTKKFVRKIGGKAIGFKAIEMMLGIF